MTEQRIDSAAEAATTTHADEGEGQGLGAPGAHTEVGTGEGRDPVLPSPEPGTGRGEDADDVPATEGERQLVETVKQIHRLEESN